MALDAVKNFAKVEVSTGYDASATSIVLTAGHGARLPDPATDGEFNLVWWNATDYPDPADDPNKEIVRCTARSTDTLTVTRNQEGSGASTKNTADKTYQMVLAMTAKMITDIETAAGEGGADFVGFSTLFENAEGARYEFSSSGSGARSVGTNLLALTTGETKAYYAKLILNFDATSSYLTSTRKVIASFCVLAVFPNGNDHQAFIGVGSPTTSGSAGITYTGNQYGWKGVRAAGGANVYSFTNGNGTSETATADSNAFNALLTCIKDGTTDIKFYSKGVLRATHTTNIPSGNFINSSVAISNVNTTANSSARISFQQILATIN